MQKHTQDFAQCLKEILTEKGISASELARMMAYKSRNTVFRILDGAGGHSARQAFFDRLAQENPLALEAEALERLAAGLEISRVGLSLYKSNAAMCELLMDHSAHEQGAPLMISGVEVDASGEERSSVSAMIDEMAGAKALELIITGCCDRRIFQALRERLARCDVTKTLRVTHFVYMGEETLVAAVSAIQPMLYTEFYTPYCVEPGVFSPEREQIYRSNCIYVRWQMEDGARYDQPFLLVDSAHFCPLRRTRAQEYDVLRSLFAEDMQRMKPMKVQMPLVGGYPDYPAYIDFCFRLEQNRATYIMKPDVPLSFVSPQILLENAKESFWAAPGMSQEELSELIGVLYDIHVQRFENSFCKKKPTHIIFSREHMEHFARIGRQSDHFFAFRAYTPQERVQILAHLRQQMQENPYFNLYFFRGDSFAPATEIGLYEGVGTLLTKPFTDYDLRGDHAEAIITQEAFCRIYKAFFSEYLLVRCVTDKEETIRILDDLIDIARRAR